MCVLWMVAVVAAIGAVVWLIDFAVVNAAIAGLIAWGSFKGIEALGDGLPA